MKRDLNKPLEMEDVRVENTLTQLEGMAYGARELITSQKREEWPITWGGLSKNQLRWKEGRTERVQDSMCCQRAVAIREKPQNIVGGTTSLIQAL